MCTFLGIAGRINETDVNELQIKNADFTFLEGYLWDEGDPKKHLIKQYPIQKNCHVIV
jgi:hypothetical protein